MGLSHSAIAPYDACPTLDQVLVGVQSDGGRRALVRLLDAPELGQDPRFANNVGRVQHRDRLDAAVAERTRRWPTAALVAALGEAGCRPRRSRRWAASSRTSSCARGAAGGP